MSDSDFFAYLFILQAQGYINNSLTNIEEIKQLWIMPQRGKQSSETSNLRCREDRESTEETEVYDELLDSPSLGLKFSDGAKTNSGAVMGWDEKCDIILPKIPGISRYHAALTFDKENRLIVRDLNSSCGTRVTYDGDGSEFRVSFDWIVGGVDFVKDKTIRIEFINGLRCRLVVPHHDIKSQQYIDNVAKFRKGTGDIEDLAQLLEVQNYPATELPTQGRTQESLSIPSRPIYLKKAVLGEGTYGIVTHVYNVTNAEESALKEPKGKFTLQGWENEVDIISAIPHDHIVKLIDYNYEPRPQLFFEYANGGSFGAYKATSDLDEVRYMRQLLSAMKAMHDCSPPIVHRDIKPDNILCFFSPDGTMSVKFADFGLGKKSEPLQTFCGTLAYAAPEIYDKVCDKNRSCYTPAVDVWSLAVVFAERQHGLPEYLYRYTESTVAWNSVVWEHFREQSRGGSEVMQFIMDYMLHIEPDMRKTASYCYEQATQLLNKLSQRPKPDGSVVVHAEDTDSSRSLTMRLGYRGSSIIKSLIHPRDDTYDGSQDTIKPSCTPLADSQVQAAADQLASTIMKRKLWGGEQADSAAPTIEGANYQEGTEPANWGLSTCVRNVLGACQAEDREGKESENVRSTKKIRLDRTK
ncbi:putative serine/threonine protein kinase [Trichoderma chlorosporum]